MEDGNDYRTFLRPRDKTGRFVTQQLHVLPIWELVPLGRSLLVFNIYYFGTFFPQEN